MIAKYLHKKSHTMRKKGLSAWGVAVKELAVSVLPSGGGAVIEGFAAAPCGG